MDNEQIKQIRKLSQRYAYTSIQMHETVARKAGFSGTDHKYLGFFLQKEKLTAGKLSNLTGLTTGAVTALIDRFEKKNLVKRQRDENDRRKVVIVPDAKKIRELLEPFYKEFQDETEKLIVSFSNKERKVIQSYLEKALKLADKTNNTLNQKKNENDG